MEEFHRRTWLKRSSARRPRYSANFFVWQRKAEAGRKRRLSKWRGGGGGGGWLGSLEREIHLERRRSAADLSVVGILSVPHAKTRTRRIT